MPLTVWCRCAYLADDYPSKDDFDDEVTFEQMHHANKFVKALKGKKVIRGYADILVRRTPRQFSRLTNENRAQAVVWLGWFAADRVREAGLLDRRLWVIPIPNHECVRDAEEPRTVAIAKALADDAGPNVFIADAVRWKQDLGSASEDHAPRDAATIYQNTRLILGALPPAGAAVVLVDDVMTLQGHMRAVAAALRMKASVKVKLGVVGGRTVHLHDVPKLVIGGRIVNVDHVPKLPKRPMSPFSEELEDYTPPLMPPRRPVRR